MTISEKEFWTVLHGMVFGAIFLLAFSGGFAGLLSLKPELITGAGTFDESGLLFANRCTMTF